MIYDKIWYKSDCLEVEFVLEVNNLKSILTRQKEIVTNLESEISKIEATDLLNENQNLNKELERYKELFEKEKANSLLVTEENKKLRNAIYEQLYSEKLQILNLVNKKLDVYYNSNIEGEINRLKAYEIAVKSRIDNMTGLLEANRVNVQDEMYFRISELSKLLEERLKQAREEILRNSEAFNENRNAEYHKLRQEQLSEEEIKGRIKQNNIEAFIGLNIINKLGVLLLIIGVITAAQFAYFRLPDLLKCIFIFVLGILMVLAGELLNKRKPNVFSLGITSGGIAILYVALALSYFNFGVLGMFPALGLCILITAAAFVLSQRYDSQTISVFALVGGYLPILSVSGSMAMIYSAMIYFIVLNVLALIISVNKRWIVTAYVGFWLNVAGSVYILLILFNERTSDALFSVDDLIAIFYIVLAFIIYTLIPIVGTYRKKLAFRNSDIVLLALNTVLSSLLLYSVFYIVALEDYTGILAVAFAAVYISMGRFIESFMEKERKVRALFYITGLTFVALVIPFQFDKMWFSLGWLIEGVVLLSYGIVKEIRSFKRAGAIISLLCLAAFLLIDVLYFEDSIFTCKYLAITAGSMVVLGSLIYKNNLASKLAKLFKYIAVLNIWFFSLYIIETELRSYLSELLLRSSFSPEYLIYSAMILISFTFAYLIPRIKVLIDRVLKITSSIIYIIGIFALFLLNFNSPVKDGNLSDVPLVISVVGTIELAVITLLSLAVVRELVLNLLADKKLGIEWYPLIISFYFVIILTQNLITQYNLEFNNAVISIVYIVTALGWITFGFIKRYVFIRRFGLGLCILSVAKLFLIDLSFLTQGYRIVSYFIFGLTLIAISFVYQYFSKKINIIGGVMPDENKSNS
ncbi:MAG: Protein of unknown function transrane [Eubacterium sp.]|jgi:hypothetical protein|nr:Protein of unknown function transrane [Eubacterium sp.]